MSDEIIISPSSPNIIVVTPGSTVSPGDIVLGAGQGGAIGPAGPPGPTGNTGNTGNTGPRGLSGVIAQTGPPSDTTVVWIDTDDPTGVSSYNIDGGSPSTNYGGIVTNIDCGGPV